MPKFDLSNIVKFLHQTFTDLKETGELLQGTTFRDYYNNFKAEIANKSLQSEDESVKKTCSNLCYLVDRIRYDNKKNSFHVGKNEFAFLSCIADNRMDNELKKKGEDFFLENLNNFRQTKFRTEIIKKRKGLSCRKKKYSIQKPLEPLKVDDLSTQE